MLIMQKNKYKRLYNAPENYKTESMRPTVQWNIDKSRLFHRVLVRVAFRLLSKSSTFHTYMYISSMMPTFAETSRIIAASNCSIDCCYLDLHLHDRLGYHANVPTAKSYSMGLCCRFEVALPAYS